VFPLSGKVRAVLKNEVYHLHTHTHTHDTVTLYLNSLRSCDAAELRTSSSQVIRVKTVRSTRKRVTMVTHDLHAAHNSSELAVKGVSGSAASKLQTVHH